MSSIRIINAASNRINAIDRDLLKNSPNLYILLLDGNVCVDGTFSDIQENLEEVTESLGTCLNNFDTEPIIECVYSVEDVSEYSCIARIHNPIDTDFAEIAGQHMDDRSDSDVRNVIIQDQNTKTFPAVICRQFEALTFIYLTNSNLEILEAQAFADCRNVQIIYIMQNRIQSLPAGLFGNSPNLGVLELAVNRISQIDANAFVGTSIYFLDLGFNQLEEINQQWLEPVRETLRLLDLNGNSIRNLRNGAFGSLPNLGGLVLNGNRFEADSSPFSGLENVTRLSLTNCGLRTINSQWFADIPRLTDLILDANAIASLPAGTFETLLNLEELRMEDNLLTSISSESFGDVVGNLRFLDFTHNVISSIDSRLLDQATNLERLFLSGNICVNRDFLDVASNVEEVRQELQECIANF